jgi:uncharacterized protein
MAVVVVLTWELSIPGCRSLKEKRTAVRSIRDRVQSRFKVSVAETAYQDIPDRAEITAAFVTSDGRVAQSMADKIDQFVAGSGRAVVVLSRREQV